MHVAILGGGLSGLSAAFHLSRRFPAAQITLFERESRLGGWVRTERVAIRDGGTALLEAGPRTLRPISSRSVLELVNLLGLQDSLITIPSTSPVAKNRFLQIPGSHGLTPIPTSPLSLFTSSLGPTLVSALIREPFRNRNRNRDPNWADESVDSFLTRRFGESFARIFGTALVHGVYAADARKLSVRAAFPTLWEAHERGRGSVIQGFLTRRKVEQKDDDYALGSVSQMLDGVSIFSFRDGIGTITTALQRYLEAKSNVRIVTGTVVDSLGINTETRTFQLSTNGNRTLNPTHVVSALPLPMLHELINSYQSNPLPHLNANPSSSVTVVNLVFPSTPNKPIHPPGFGYLIPRPSSDYDIQHSGFLGTVFDSCATSRQDTCAPDRIVKTTVMMGGPHPITPDHTSLPTILRHLTSHLFPLTHHTRVLPDPLFCRVHHHKECIPTFTVGHVERMKELSEVLAREPWCGRLEVIGAGVGGVSVGDCVKAGREVGRHWA